MLDQFFGGQETLESFKSIATSGHINRTPEAEAYQFVKSFRNKDTTIFNGGAKGWDTLVIENCIEFDVPYILYLPFEASKNYLTPFILSHAKEIKVFKKKYEGPQDKYIYFKRNNEMIDKGLETHIFWDGRKKGGTYASRKYSIKTNKKVVNWFESS